LIWLKKNKVRLLKLSFLLLLSIIFSSGHIENPDTHLRLTQSRFLIDNGSFALEPGYGDITHGNIAYNNEGIAYSVYNPGQILLFVPISYLGSFINIQGVDSYYIIAFMASFIGYFVYGLLLIVFFNIGVLLKIPIKSIIFSVITFAFTSYCFSHSQDGYEHIYEALFILLAWLYLLKGRNHEGYKYFLFSSLFIGLGLMFRTTTLLAVPGIMFLIGSWKYRVLYGLTIIPFILMLLFYNYFRFDNPFDNGYQKAWELAFNHLGIIGFRLNTLPKHIFGLLIYPGKGLLFFSPSIILGIIGWRKSAIKEYKLLISVIITVGLYLIIYGANFAWHGSAWSWGPRYIVPIIPLIYIGLFFFFHSTKNLKHIYTFLILISFFIQILSVSVYYKRQLVRVYEEHGDVFWSNDYFFTFKYFPLSEQTISFLEISESTFNNKKLNLFLPLESWRNESRPASLSMMLNNSIDFNAYNFWWIRLQYFPFVSPIIKFGALILVAISFILFSLVLFLNYKY